jgi:hypothetical protein
MIGLSASRTFRLGLHGLWNGYDDDVVVSF